MARKDTDKGKVGLRSSGTRVISFGLVAIPIGTAPMRDKTDRPGGKFLDPVDHLPVKQAWLAHDGEVVARDELVKGYESTDGFVVLDDGKDIKLPASSTISLVANIRRAELAGAMIEDTKLIWPHDEGANDGFMLLLAYCRDNDRALIGTVNEGGTEKAYAVAYDDATSTLVMYLLAYEATVRWANVTKVASFTEALPEPNAAMMDMANNLFDALPDTYEWASVTDTYGESLRAEIARHAAGTAEAPLEQGEAAVPQADTLMEALRASVDAQAKEKEAIAA